MSVTKKVVGFLLIAIIASSTARADTPCLNNWARTQKMIHFLRDRLVCQQTDISAAQCKNQSGIGGLSKAAGYGAAAGLVATTTYGLKNYRKPKFCMFSQNFEFSLFNKAYAAGACVPVKDHLKKEATALMNLEISETKKVVDEFKRKAKLEKSRIFMIEKKLKNIWSSSSSYKTKALQGFIVDDQPGLWTLSSEEIQKLDKKFPGLSNMVLELKKNYPYRFRVRGSNAGKLYRNYYLAANNKSEELNKLLRGKSRLKKAVTLDEVVKALDSLPDRSNGAGSRKRFLQEMVHMTPSSWGRLYGNVGKRVAKKIGSFATGAGGLVYTVTSTANDLYDLGNFTIREVKWCSKSLDSIYAIENTKCEATLNIPLLVQSQVPTLKDELQKPRVCELLRKTYMKAYGPENWSLTCPTKGRYPPTEFKLTGRHDKRLSISGKFNRFGAIDNLSMKLRKDQKKPDKYFFSFTNKYKGSQLASISAFDPGYFSRLRYKAGDVGKINLNEDEEPLSRSYGNFLDYHLVIHEAISCCRPQESSNAKNCDAYGIDSKRQTSGDGKSQ